MSKHHNPEAIWINNILNVIDRDIINEHNKILVAQSHLDILAESKLKLLDRLSELKGHNEEVFR